MRVMVSQFRYKAMDFVIANLLQVKIADSAHREVGVALVSIFIGIWK